MRISYILRDAGAAKDGCEDGYGCLSGLDGAEAGGLERLLPDANPSVRSGLVVDYLAKTDLNFVWQIWR